MDVISENRSYGGVQQVLRHRSAALGCDMTLGLFLPRESADGPVPVLIGGRLNQIPEDSNSSLPVDVTGALRGLGVTPCAGLEEIAGALAGLASKRDAP